MLALQDKTYPQPAAGARRYIGKAAPGGGAVVTSPGTSLDLMTVRPAPGYIKSIHANNLASIFPPTGQWYSGGTGSNGPWALWCGAVFSPDYSQHGAMIYWGGGHLGYDGTEFYIFDLTTQLWSRLNDPVPTDFKPLVTNEFNDALVGGSYVMPPAHTYSSVAYVPPSAGGGTKGSFCIVFHVYAEAGAGGVTVLPKYAPHAIDLATGVWRRLTDNTDPGQGYGYGAYGGAFTDTTRNVIWGFSGTESGNVAKIDLTATQPHLVLQNTGGGDVTYAVPVYIPEVDKVVQVAIYDDGTKRIRLAIFDMDQAGYIGTPRGYAISNNPAGAMPRFTAAQVAAVGRAGISIDFCPDTWKFYCFEAYGTNLLYVATPPGPVGTTTQWKTGEWSWSTETMLGETSATVEEVVSTSGAHPLNKWKYHRPSKCFMWSAGGAVRNSPDGSARAGAFQLYRPLGT